MKKKRFSVEQIVGVLKQAQVIHLLEETAYDRMLATRYGTAAIDLVHAGKFGRVVVLKGTQISDIPIGDAIAKTGTVGEDLFEVVKGLQPR
jgi:ATP-dependent phosphofructokinase / diphosphate-dependent phosphofructokinase